MPHNIHDPPQSVHEPPSTQQLACEAKGGKWDPNTNTCILPPEPEPKTELGVIRGERGRLTGFTRGEDSFLGLKPSQVIAEVTAESKKRDLPVGGQAEATLERQRQELQRQGSSLATSVGATPSQEILSQLESQISARNVSYLGAIASAVPGIVPDLIGGFATGAAAGAGVAAVAGQLGPQVATPEEIITVPAAAVTAGTIFAIANVVKGVYTDFVSDVARQKRELIETPIRSLSETKPVLGELVNAQNANPENAISNKQEFDNQLAFIDIEYERLKDLTDGNLNSFLGDTGINQIQEFEVFYIPNGERDRLIRDMELSLANPDPARIRPTLITLEDIKKRIEELETK